MVELRQGVLLVDDEVGEHVLDRPCADDSWRDHLLVRQPIQERGDARIPLLKPSQEFSLVNVFHARPSRRGSMAGILAIFQSTGTDRIVLQELATSVGSR